MPRPPVRRHVFVCMNRRPPGHPKGSCVERGAAEVLQRLQDIRIERGLFEEYRPVATGCLGPCDGGPTIAVFPDDTWYGGVRPEDVEEIVETHLLGGRPVERLT